MENKLKALICMCTLVSSVYAMKKKPGEEKIDIWGLEEPITKIEPSCTVKTPKICDLQPSKDKKTLYLASPDKTIDIWSLGPNTLQKTDSIKMQNSIISMALSGDDKTLFLVETGAIVAMDLSTKISSTFATPGPDRNEEFKKVFFTKEILISVSTVEDKFGDKSGLIKKWNGETQKQEKGVIFIRDSDMFSTTLSPCKKLLVTGGSDHTITLINLKNFKVLKKIKIGFDTRDRITSLVVPNKDTIIAGTASDRLFEWNHKENKVKKHKLASMGITFSLQISEDGRKLAVGSVNKILLTELGPINYLFKTTGKKRPFEEPEEKACFTSLVFTNNGSLIGGSRDGGVTVWNLPTSEKELMNNNLKKQAGENPKFTDVIIKGKKE
jgi:WD40 repeat protein